MNSLQIEYFIKAAEYNSITRAAEHFYISQPAMSRVIHSLEKELGLVLFERTNKGVTLSESGNILYEALSQATKLIADAVKKAHLSDGGRTGSISLTILSGLDTFPLIMPYLDRFNESFPNITIQTRRDDFYYICESLKKGLSDIVLTIAASLTNRHNLNLITIAESPRVLIYSKQLSVAAESHELTPYSFRNTPFLAVIDKNPMAEILVTQYCEPYGFVPEILPVSNIDSLITNVQHCKGVAVIDSYSRDLKNSSFGFIEMDSSEKLVLAWNKNNSNPALETLTDWLNAEFSD